MKVRFLRLLFPILVSLHILLVLLGLSVSNSTIRAAQFPRSSVALFGSATDEADRAGNESLLSLEQDYDEEITEQLIVVRAYFDDRQMVYELASWNEPWEVRYDEGYLVIGVTPTEYDRLLAAGFRLEIDEELTAEMNQVRVPNQEGGGIPGYACYRTVEETLDTIYQLAIAYPTLATWVDIGDSWEKTQDMSRGYDLIVLKLTNREMPGPKPKFFAMSSVHAREYAPAELNTRFAEYLLEHYGSDPDVTWILDHHEIHLLLQANPDGRKQAETGLSWRKNTNNNFCSNSNDRGVDLNRNYSFSWNYCGNDSCSSSNECNLTYRGPSAASEPETQAVEAYLRSEFPDQRDEPITAAAPLTATGIFMDLHSYSELVLWPWGFNAAAPNETELKTLGRKMGYFNNYYPQQAVDLYPTDGATDDFAYGELGVASYTFEMGTSFFQSCSIFENTVLPDNLPALIYTAKVARSPYMTPAGPEVLNLSLSNETIAPLEEVTLEVTVNDTRFNSQNGSEATQPIAAAEYYIDVPPWITTSLPVALPMSASDGTFNSSIEDVTATIDSSGLSVGKHIIFVRGQDDDGNWGAFSAIFLNIVAGTSTPTATPVSPTNTPTNTPQMSATATPTSTMMGSVTPTLTGSTTATATSTATATMTPTGTITTATPTSSPTITTTTINQRFYLPLIRKSD